jgi:hypothetical protein
MKHHADTKTPIIHNVRQTPNNRVSLTCYAVWGMAWLEH